MTDLFSPSHLLGLIERYSSFGVHRTGWDADERVSDWLIEWLGRHGIEGRRVPFTFPRVSQRAAYIAAGDARIEGVPLHDGGATGAGGVDAALTTDAAAAEGRILVIEGPQALPQHLEGQSGVAGIAVVNGDPEGNIVLLNGEAIDHPFTLPVIQVARKDAGPLLAAAAARGQARLVLDFERVPSTATNVEAMIRAPSATGLVVLLTPKSGWFTCAAERGGGLSITMALAAELAARRDRRKDVLVLFTSGHEINYYGLLEYLKQHPGLRDEAEVWVQLGACIGAKNQPAWRALSRHDDLRELIAAAVERQGIAPSLAPKEQRPAGEAREVFDRRFLAMAGGSPYFHSPRDIPEVSVDAERTARFALAFREVMAKLVL